MKKQSVKYLLLIVLVGVTLLILHLMPTPNNDWWSLLILGLILSTTYARILEFILGMSMTVMVSRGNLSRWSSLGPEQKGWRAFYVIIHTAITIGAIYVYCAIDLEMR